MKKLYLFLETIYHVKLTQIFNRVYRKFRRIYFKSPPSNPIFFNYNLFFRCELLENKFVDDNTVSLLNEKGELLNWQNKDKTLLWLYNLHYFDYLNTKRASSHINLHKIVINNWISTNPFNQGVGWEPYPLSLRIVNWIKYHWTLNKLSKHALESLWLQTHVLKQKLEFHLLGNHIFANAKALIFAGCFFECEDSKKWFKTGLKILNSELTEQVLEDGGNFELSPMYHNIILADLLDLYNLANSSKRSELLAEAENWESIIKKMLLWSKDLSHPDGKLSFFNDSAFGIAADFEELSEYARKLGISITDLENRCLQTNVERELIHYERSGYIIVNDKKQKTIIDVACVGPDYIPGHAHADTLSFEMSIGTHRLFVNSGTSVYGTTNERLRQRKTASHNTLTIDGNDSSEVWSGFRVAKRAYPLLKKVEQTKSTIEIICAHDGFTRLSGSPIHQRSWLFTDEGLEIKDEISPHKSRGVSHFHLHPSIKAESLTNNEVRLTLPNNDKIMFTSIGTIEVLPSSWHPEFGTSIPNIKLNCNLINNSNIISIRFG
ncbi:alginate lyase family protein [Pseudoalteromonas sp. BZP1]|uniref:heparinase II/III family protein n=1 Tax=unclassified Pseudoalteromonas TaxID=194690 RepID=UPI0032C3FD6E